jgi:hypothetical protein
MLMESPCTEEGMIAKPLRMNIALKDQASAVIKPYEASFHEIFLDSMLPFPNAV